MTSKYLDRILSWLKREKKKANVLVFPKSLFPHVVEMLKGQSGIAYISIENTPECAKYYNEAELGDFENSHYLPSGPGVLNLNFDDVGRKNGDPDTKNWNGHVFRSINEEEADQAVEFIENHLGEQFIVHCKAGVSRSQAFARFILDCYPEYYETCPENEENPCYTPNVDVLSKLKRAYYRIHGFPFEEEGK